VEGGNIKFVGDDRSQVLLLAGVAITIAIISFAMVSVSLSSIHMPIDKSSFIKSEFDNIRREFGVALIDKAEDGLKYPKNIFNDLFMLYFNDTRDVFIFVEVLHDNYFYAELVEITYTVDEPRGFIVLLTLFNEDEYISEEISYEF